MDLLEEIEDDATRLFSSVIYRYQTSIVGRIDDCAKFLSENLTRNFQHNDYRILTRLCWSKNVRIKADAP